MGKVTHLTFIDIETTGHNVNGTTDAIVEIAGARVDLSTRVITDTFEALIRPWGEQSNCAFYNTPHHGQVLTWNLNRFHTDAGHFDGVYWERDGVDCNLALDMFTETLFVDGATIAGQNPEFDLRHLRRDFVASGRPWPQLDYHRFDLCSPAMFLTMAGSVESPSLRNTAPWAGCGPQKHRAADDVVQAIRVFWAMYDAFIGTKSIFRPNT